MKITKLPSPIVLERWDQIAPLLEKACGYSNGRFTPETVLQGVGSGNLQVFIAFEDDDTIKAAAVTCVTLFGTGLKVCEILLLGGEERKSWLHFQDHVRRWAALEECDSLVVHGRKGWAKDLSDWKVTGMTFERPVRENG